MDKKKTSFISKLKNLKRKEILIAVIAIVVMLAIYFTTVSGTKETTNYETARSDYCETVAEEMKKAISKMSGDDGVKVVISWQGGVESVIAYTRTEGQNSSATTPSVIQQTGGSKPIILKEIYPAATGVVIVTKNGGSNVKLRLQLKEMAATLLGISPEKVAVYDSK